MALCALAALALLIGLSPPAAAQGDSPYYITVDPKEARISQHVVATLWEKSPDPSLPDAVLNGKCEVVWHLWSDPKDGYTMVRAETLEGPAIDGLTIPPNDPLYNFGWVSMYIEEYGAHDEIGFTINNLLIVNLVSQDPIQYAATTPLKVQVLDGQAPYTYRIDYKVHENTTTYHFSKTGEAREDEFYVDLPLCPGNGITVNCHITDVYGRQGDAPTMNKTIVDAPAGEAMRVVSRQQSAAGALPDQTVRAEMNIEGGDMPYDGSARWYVNTGSAEVVYETVPLPFADAHTNLFGKLPASMIQQHPGLKKFYLGLTIKDTSGRVFRPSPFEFLVYHKLSADSAIVPPAATQDGQVTARITVKGGTPPYTGKFSWKVYAKDSDPAHLFTKSVEVTSSTGTLSNTLDLKGLDWANLDDSGEVFIEAWDSAQGYTGDQYVHWFSILKHPMTRGDANDDGRINMEDLTHILDHMIRHAILISPEGADANADGRLDVADLKRIIDMVVK